MQIDKRDYDAGALGKWAYGLSVKANTSNQDGRDFEAAALEGKVIGLLDVKDESVTLWLQTEDGFPFCWDSSKASTTNQFLTKTCLDKLVIWFELYRRPNDPNVTIVILYPQDFEQWVKGRHKKLSIS